MKLHFIIKEDNKLYVIQDMPEEPTLCNGEQMDRCKSGIAWDESACCDCDKYENEYEQALQTAKYNAIEVDNQGEVKFALYEKHSPEFDGFGNWFLKEGNIYFLDCKMEAKNYCPCKLDRCEEPVIKAFITFEEPETEDNDIVVRLKSVKEFKIKVCNCDKKEETQEDELIKLKWTLERELRLYAEDVILWYKGEIDAERFHPDNYIPMVADRIRIGLNRK